MNRVSTIFDVSYGGRVWGEGATMITGQSIQIETTIEREADSTPPSVRTLHWFQQFLDQNISGRFIIGRNDPLFERLLGGTISVRQKTPSEKAAYLDIGGEFLELYEEVIPETDQVIGYSLDTSKLDDSNTQQYYSSFFIVGFNPTEPALCKWMFDVLAVKMNALGILTSKVEIITTDFSRHSYSGSLEEVEMLCDGVHYL
jgi:hypothetical protein